MNPALLYLILVQATLSSFSGLSSLPVVHSELVAARGLLTATQLHTAVAIARLSPGPFGLYMVPVGYYAGGWAGSIAGFLAMLTPAFLIVPILRYLGGRSLGPQALGAIGAVTHASAGLILAALVPIARDTLTTPWQAVLAVLAAAVLATTTWDSIWTIAAGALLGLLLGKAG